MLPFHAIFSLSPYSHNVQHGNLKTSKVPLESQAQEAGTYALSLSLCMFPVPPLVDAWLENAAVDG